MRTHPTGVQMTLLIVEDNPIVQDLLSVTLASSYKILQAGSGEEALAICNSTLPDMVILDDGLPGMSGEEVAEVLSRQLNIPFLVLTADPDSRKIDRYIAMGASTYLVKPVSPDNLLSTIKAAHNNSRNISKLLLKSNGDHYIGRAVASLMLLDGVSEQHALNTLKQKARRERKKLWLKAREIFESRLKVSRIT